MNKFPRTFNIFFYSFFLGGGMYYGPDKMLSSGDPKTNKIHIVQDALRAAENMHKSSISPEGGEGEKTFSQKKREQAVCGVILGPLL